MGDDGNIIREVLENAYGGPKARAALDRVEAERDRLVERADYLARRSYVSQASADFILAKAKDE